MRNITVRALPGGEVDLRVDNGAPLRLSAAEARQALDGLAAATAGPAGKPEDAPAVGPGDWHVAPQADGVAVRLLLRGPGRSIGWVGVLLSKHSAGEFANKINDHAGRLASRRYPVRPLRDPGRS